MMMGRGRGRGVSNLPAWLVEQQRKQAAAADTAALGSTAKLSDNNDNRDQN
eukprot:CAMPEP_0178747336 /NCGR_PEP_ID=MMETSP0744-20121128/8266_1 /TAXON_ID=913974 /ORGANISM="Nitzschia punctata, Strain CCMP561" /LENGTH=50 /DNA_ID=CAMNT_0020400563 /DNA_START=41 /DNA_END=193 /DNA_ORIENTATION=-